LRRFPGHVALGQGFLAPRDTLVRLWQVPPPPGTERPQASARRSYTESRLTSSSSTTCGAAPTTIRPAWYVRTAGQTAPTPQRNARRRPTLCLRPPQPRLTPGVGAVLCRRLELLPTRPVSVPPASTTRPNPRREFGTITACLRPTFTGAFRIKGVSSPRSARGPWPRRPRQPFSAHDGGRPGRSMGPAHNNRDLVLPLLAEHRPGPVV